MNRQSEPYGSTDINVEADATEKPAVCRLFDGRFGDWGRALGVQEGGFTGVGVAPGLGLIHERGEVHDRGDGKLDEGDGEGDASASFDGEGDGEGALVPFAPESLGSTAPAASVVN